VRAKIYKLKAILFAMESIDTRKTSASGVYAPVSLFDAVDMLSMANLVKAPQIFASGLSNRLNVALAMLYAVFKAIYQKFDRRRMVLIYRFTP